MRCILSPQTDPRFNLAAEEFLFRNYDEDTFFLYVNSPSVVVGKHQNALAEINPQFVREKKIQIIRRLSGGGAVYHDLGNLNFSFHQTVEDVSKVSFNAFNQPVVEVLNQLGVPAEIGKRNDIIVNGFKISGHAEHVFRKRILSHGTLLFNAEKESLSKVLKNSSAECFSGKSIPSVRSKVANLTEFLTEPLSLDQFIQLVQNHILKQNEDGRIDTLSDDDLKGIQQLIDEKYCTWKWNFGYSPKYRFNKKVILEGAELSISLFVVKGDMIEVQFTGSLLDDEQKAAVQNLLINSPHEYDSIKNLLSTLDLNPLNPEMLMDCFF
jgi:lipoate-protein ligase A